VKVPANVALRRIGFKPRLHQLELEVIGHLEIACPGAQGLLWTWAPLLLGLQDSSRTRPPCANIGSQLRDALAWRSRAGCQFSWLRL